MTCTCGNNILNNNANYCDYCWNHLVTIHEARLYEYTICLNCGIENIYGDHILCSSCYKKNLPLTYYSGKLKGIYYII